MSSTITIRTRCRPKPTRRHVCRHPSKGARRIVVVNVDVHRETTRQERTPAWAAELVRVVALELETVRVQGVNVRRLDLARVLPRRAVKADVGPPDIVREQDDDVGLWRGRECEGASGGNEGRRGRCCCRDVHC